ncbi:MAG: glycosyltransferase [Hydrogenophaga sp.]|uniref:glycosyltransferase n=1 Tax=Hydrogenophaga sp. TaxID=1904254 RepID=UPI0025B8672F|nr:glycosyltransferase [Hydrogenophaga sp.]MBT9551226.1 glycosyltransferase [Hydrogenophaga sp.]
MRIVIDLQAVQAENRLRGIGRYSLSLALAMVRKRGEHEVLIALNGLFPDTIEPIRAAFNNLLPQENIRVWNAVAPVAGINTTNDWRRHSAELVREAFLTSLRPDVVHICSLFEGLGDDAVSSVGALSRTHPTAVTLFDLIPYIHRKPYLEDPAVEAWYLGKIEHLRRADLWLTISESSRREGIDHLGLPHDRSVNISTDADATFQRIEISAESEKTLRQQYGLHRPFLMYTGGIDHRKNIEGLIRAFSKLPTVLRNAHQLAIVCSMQPGRKQLLERLAAQVGLGKDEMVLTGFVPEDDLLALYNLCTLFVFPSWHEGFGLPALEAMRCGAPVIAADTSSLPEVVGWADALFDPHSDEAITRAVERALTDAAFRAQLIAHGQMQSVKFSWDMTARRAIDAMERLVIDRTAQRASKAAPPNRLRLAYVSPLPPERSGISDYSTELLPALAQHYEIEVVVAQDSVTDAWIKANCPIRSLQWFAENSKRFDRVLYHFGNSAFHQHMFGLLSAAPGVVVLHDFYLSGILHHMDATGRSPGCFTEQLYRSHGYAALLDRAHATNETDVIWEYPCSRDVIESGIGTIVHSENSIQLAQRWYGHDVQAYSVIPLLRVQERSNKASAARNALGFSDNDFLVCSFGILGPSKLNHRLLQAWLDSSLAKLATCHLVFVGENHADDYGTELLALIKRHPNGSSVDITGWVEKETFQKYLNAADLGVQLRSFSRGETSAAALDCMNYGLATIVNANGSMADLDDDAVWKLPDEFDDQALIDALETLWRDRGRRKQIGTKARSVILENHDPIRCAQQYKVAIEGFYKNQGTLKNLITAISAIPTAPMPECELEQLAYSMATTFPPARAGKSLLVDISELVQRDAKTGIQRVVRSILKHWLLNPPAGWRVEPVYATASEPYRYARQYTTTFLSIPSAGLADEVIDFSPGDIFFVLDFQPQVQAAQASFYQHLRAQGVTVKFHVYDLLCILQSQHFQPGAAEVLSDWLQVVGESDGAICISKAVALELQDWMRAKTWKRLRSFQLTSNPLGADFSGSAPSRGLPSDADHVLATIKQRPSFLMVGTLEPRKGHAQALGAFELLWQSGVDVNLVIVGKQGWMVEPLAEKLRSHNERERRLIWLEGISDEYLEHVYVSSTCLIAGSYGEGFGLPLIEAAQHNLPIIARDIPVFREVAGKHAFYFNAITSEQLTQFISNWLTLYQEHKQPKSDNMPWLSWNQSSNQLLQVIFDRVT